MPSSTKLALYQILDTETNLPVSGMSFVTQALAKQVRRELCDMHRRPLGFIVTPGPDHKRYNPNAHPPIPPAEA